MIPVSGTSRITHLEELCLNTWPAARTVHHDGWVMSLSEGHTKRANSVWPLTDHGLSLEGKVAFCEGMYGEAGLPCSFKLTDAAAPKGLDGFLSQRGYGVVDRSAVRHMDITGAVWEEDPRIQGQDGPNDVWVDAYSAMAGYDPETRNNLRTLLDRISFPSRCVVLREGKRPCAMGIGVRQGRLLTFYNIRVDPDWRRRGYGRAIMETLLAWGLKNGAHEAVVQVVKDNAPAVGLYGGLGFRELYTYWYRRKDSRPHGQEK